MKTSKKPYGLKHQSKPLAQESNLAVEENFENSLRK